MSLIEDRLLDEADVVIAENIDTIKSAYVEGKQMATHNHRVAGLNKAYGKLNELLRLDFRKHINISQATRLNTKIKALLTLRHEIYI